MPRKLNLITGSLYEDWITRQIRTTKHIPNTHKATRHTVRLTKELLIRAILELHYKTQQNTKTFQNQPEFHHNETTQTYTIKDGKNQQTLTKKDHKQAYNTLETLRKSTNQK